MVVITERDAEEVAIRTTRGAYPQILQAATSPTRGQEPTIPRRVEAASLLSQREPSSIPMGTVQNAHSLLRVRPARWVNTFLVVNRSKRLQGGHSRRWKSLTRRTGWIEIEIGDIREEKGLLIIDRSGDCGTIVGVQGKAAMALRKSCNIRLWDA
jgi:hypothetical protein